MITKPCKCGRLPRIQVVDSIAFTGAKITFLSCQCRYRPLRIGFGETMVESMTLAIRWWNDLCQARS